MGILTNSKCCISWGLALVEKIKKPSSTEIYHNSEALKVQNGQSHTYCINMYGKIDQSIKG